MAPVGSKRDTFESQGRGNSGRPKEKPERVSVRRDRILEVATEEFGAKGYAGARVDEIARRSRANKQLIYYYFGNKQGLYDAVFGYLVELTRRELDSRPECATFEEWVE